jgi:DNA-binding response OmpR family regulator
VPPEPQGFRILIVDDDPDHAGLLATVVTQAGFAAPQIAGTAREALRLAEGVDLVLLDYQLPDGNGLSLLPAFRAMPGQPVVIMVTGHGDEALAARALRAGANDYLIKDASLPGLLPEVVEHARRNRALQDALAAAERDLVHAERMAAIGQLAVTVSHNVNNPLMAAFAETELLLSDRKLLPEHRAVAASIRDSLLRISDILQQVGNLRHDQVTEYPGGLEMIDLSRRKRATPVNAGDALVWLADETLNRVVQSLLKHAGFNVERPASLDALGKRASDSGVTVVVVLGSDTPGTDPLGGFRPAPGHRYTLVALTPGNVGAAQSAGADHVVRLPFDPGTFTAELLAAMRA